MNTTRAVTLDQLNQIANLRDRSDKYAAISAEILTLIEAGASLPDAFDAVLGEGSYAAFSGDLYDAPCQKAPAGDH